MSPYSWRFDPIEAQSRFADVEGFVHIWAVIGSKYPLGETAWLEKMRLETNIPYQIVGHADIASPGAVDQLEKTLVSFGTFRRGA